MRRIVGKRLPNFSKEESYLVKDSSDFLGLIHYTTTYTADLSSPRQGDYASDMHASIIRMFFLNGIFWVCFFFTDSLFHFIGQPLGILHWSMYVSPNSEIWHVLIHQTLLIKSWFLVIRPHVDLLPWGLEGLLEYIKQNYANPPIYILENGLSLNMLWT